MALAAAPPIIWGVIAHPTYSLLAGADLVTGRALSMIARSAREHD